MSEWSPCPKCGTERESGCACLNSKCEDYAPLLYTHSARLTTDIGTAFQKLTDDFENAQAVKESQAATIADLRMELVNRGKALLQLEAWKTEQLTVTAWWAQIDKYVRARPSTKLGAYVAAETLRLLQEGDEARDWVQKLQRTTQTLTCVYCGKEYPPGSPAHGAAVLTEHIRVCEKHPMRKLEAEIVSLGAENRRLAAEMRRTY